MQTRHDPLTVVATAPVAGPTATPVQTPAPAAPARKGLKKVSLGGIAKKESDTTNKYPVFPDETGAAGELADPTRSSLLSTRCFLGLPE